ncbi:hypothetical protein O7608_15725 [Solwaraspora sp. WMMA2056]|uniref:hypothetical protein n=1 Tax=Solwaraspora sp. WMMA2056 TaxID=3015161 RepID=UPI00259B02DE|nr:hypothetical protein [Solwaraspora sp. WMMA2056]WJK43727.1 hypothetical protein O7608_15725 [Solwaraspora sp. WMMA2056]
MFDGELRRLDGLRTRYGGAWGDDEIGNEFRKQFDQTMDVVEGIILGVRGTLEYAATGLRISGEGYQQAEDEANEAGRAIGDEFAVLPTRSAVHPDPSGTDKPPVQLSPTQNFTVMEETPDRTDNPATQLTPTQNFIVMEEAPDHADEPPVQLSPTQNFTVMEETPDHTDNPATQLTPTHSLSIRAEAPGDSAAAMPLLSSHVTYRTDGVLIDGAPVPEGYELQKLNTFGDGVARLDLNCYDSVQPLVDHHVVAGPDNRPVDPGDGQLFLVRTRDDADFDPASPGYQPMLVSFLPDGTAVPI